MQLCLLYIACASCYQRNDISISVGTDTFLNKRERKTKGQSKIDNPEKLAT